MRNEALKAAIHRTLNAALSSMTEADAKCLLATLTAKANVAADQAPPDIAMTTCAIIVPPEVAHWLHDRLAELDEKQVPPALFHRVRMEPRDQAGSVIELQATKAMTERFAEWKRYEVERIRKLERDRSAELKRQAQLEAERRQHGRWIATLEEAARFDAARVVPRSIRPTEELRAAVDAAKTGLIPLNNPQVLSGFKAACRVFSIDPSEAIESLIAETKERIESRKAPSRKKQRRKQTVEVAPNI